MWPNRGVRLRHYGQLRPEKAPFMLVFQLAVIAVLLLVAREQRKKCQWDWRRARRRMIWGIVVIVFVQTVGFVIGRDPEYTLALGLMAIIQWVAIYWLALALHRRGDLKRARLQSPAAGIPSTSARAVPSDYLQHLAIRIGHNGDEFLHLCSNHPALADKLKELAKSFPALLGTDEEKNALHDRLVAINAVLALNNYSMLLAENGSSSDAEKVLQFSMALQPRNPMAWYIMAKLLFLNGDAKAAAVWANKLLQFTPDSASSDLAEQSYLRAMTDPQFASENEAILEEMRMIKEEATKSPSGVLIPTSPEAWNAAIAEARERMGGLAAKKAGK